MSQRTSSAPDYVGTQLASVKFICPRPNKWEMCGLCVVFSCHHVSNLKRCMERTNATGDKKIKTILSVIKLLS